MKISTVSPLALPALLLALAAFSSAEAKKKVLIYSYTEGFRHYSIPTAVKTIRSLGKNNTPGWDSVHSEDPTDFNKDGYLDQFDALVFVSVSGKALSTKGAANMRKYIEAGGGYMGIHEACDALDDHAWYGRLVGAYFDYHPEICHATLNVEDRSHPSVAHLGKTWKVYDEMYNFRSNPRDYGKQLVLSADESSYPDPVTSKADRAALQGSPHPIAWYKEGGQLDYNPHVKVGGGTDPKKKDRKKHVEGKGGDGRSFYTALGHTNASWRDSDFQGHILGALRWVLESPTLRSSSPDADSSRPGSKYDGDSSSSSDDGDGSDSDDDGGASVSSSNANVGVDAGDSSDTASLQLLSGSGDAEPTSIVVNGHRVPYSSGNVHAASSPSSSAASPPLAAAGALQRWTSTAVTLAVGALACGVVAL
ncbi:uncharacterized protein PFL1_06026 [Pseudozyma flocculosa PF-1]|uniref:ThuA-like domain-containing protein n=2 Tax=Pseudozyma flocculosa TaxID=84751 RepID=A0A5C3F4I3_9BASI|nr:uncharacterized protein PFL1_06026 [Pseudozyma flocculosa PF-1]EPQ26378.1 hypothetical protein PFL1_06026 [Pseudozyma flocculosa PF-1]SPO39030.1 uncharacterized protein PSFLO_04509 [Pseudozyma flocculosa]